MSVDGIIPGLREVVIELLAAAQWPVLVYFVLINTSYIVFIALAAWDFVHHLRRVEQTGRQERVASEFVPPVTLVVPMYNEAAGIVQSIQSLLSLRYPQHEVVGVDDGSTDETFERLREAFDLVEVDREIPRELPVKAEILSIHVPRNGRTPLTIIRKTNSGRSDAVNVGINAASGELCVFVDADSILDPDALITVTVPFADDPTRMVATGGVIRAANGSRVVAGRLVEPRMPRQLLPRIQVVEYLRAFLIGRAGWSRLGALVLISGAFGVFRRDILVEVGGLDTESIGEDFEVLMRVHQHLQREGRDYRVKFVGEPVCWTEVPSTAKVLQKQRARWHRGLWETLWKYKHMMLNPRYGKVGMLAIPYYWLFELIAPLLEFAGLLLVILGLALDVINVPFALLFMLIAYGYAILVTLAAMTLEEMTFRKYARWRDLGTMLMAAIAENIGYRQLTAWWRLQGWWASLRGRKQVWGTMTRVGLGEESKP
ncbi:glycosyltransferase family 2 protein [Knoellia flava]|uniref:Glycosyl transferase family 2 n=1 Tax=Knoellia flava TaxID=913969 RepID=A0A8H9FRI6_9MICO|nr:glycosyltransferase [Knoellia flava]GGB65949.1 glycosyl transferase family 2 [Knoellia flava]